MRCQRRNLDIEASENPAAHEMEMQDATFTETSENSANATANDNGSLLLSADEQ